MAKPLPPLPLPDRPRGRGLAASRSSASRSSASRSAASLLLLLALLSFSALLADASSGRRRRPSDGSFADNSPVACSRSSDAYCPPNTKCCPVRRRRRADGGDAFGDAGAEGDDDVAVAYSCLVSWSSRVPLGSCCDDGSPDGSGEGEEEEEEGEFFGSGCAAGYSCASAPSAFAFEEAPSFAGEGEDAGSLASGPHCRRDPSRKSAFKVEIERVPRYRTCPAFEEAEVAAPRGLPIPKRAAAYRDRLRGGGDEDEAQTLAEGEEARDDEGEEEGEGEYIGALAYFSNLGPLASPSQSNVKTAVVGIHGSGADAGSYFCAMVAASADIYGGESDREAEREAAERLKEVGLDSKIARTLRGPRGDEGRDGDRAPEDPGDDGKVLVVAPWFLRPVDGDPPRRSDSSNSDLPFLRWRDEAPVMHTFRYGAESLPADFDPYERRDEGQDQDEHAGGDTISSYGAMDVLLETLCDRALYPDLERIVVAGHSAGGQFVHRWAVSSSSWCWGDGDDDGPRPSEDLPRVRAVAANPRSYAYLDGRRYFPTSASADGSDAILETPISNGGGRGRAETLTPFDELRLRLPSASERDDCPEYDSYCWGLEDNPDVPAPYVSSNVASQARKSDEWAGEVDAGVYCRYASRDVVYLSGEEDTAKLGDQICHEDGYQGPTRRERSERFYAALQELARHGACGEEDEDEDLRVHRRLVVRDVPHDHALMFQSEEGREGMFS